MQRVRGKEVAPTRGCLLKSFDTNAEISAAAVKSSDVARLELRLGKHHVHRTQTAFPIAPLSPLPRSMAVGHIQIESSPPFLLLAYSSIEVLGNHRGHSSYMDCARTSEDAPCTGHSTSFQYVRGAKVRSATNT